MIMMYKWSGSVWFAFIVGFVCMPMHPTEAVLDDVIEVMKLGKDIASTLLETWNLVEQTHNGDDVQLPFQNKRQKEILKRINEVSGQINRFEDDVCGFFVQFTFLPKNPSNMSTVFSHFEFILLQSNEGEPHESDQIETDFDSNHPKVLMIFHYLLISGIEFRTMVRRIDHQLLKHQHQTGAAHARAGRSTESHQNAGEIHASASHQFP